MSERHERIVAVLIPCFNERATIGKVVDDFRNALPDATIYVFDNNSRDATKDEATRTGAIVREVRYQGKGEVVRRMFADVDAEIYVLVDGDDTYSASSAPGLIATLEADHLDMVLARRITADDNAYRLGHRLGNRVLNSAVAWIFGRSVSDMLSGYRVFSRRYVKSFPAHARGFEIETELTVHALEQRMPIVEVKTEYGARPEGSASKLHTYRDGLRILATIIKLFKVEKPLLFFSMGAMLCWLTAGALAVPIFNTYLATGLVPRLPTAVLCTALVLLGALLFACGLILDTVTRGRLEAKRFAYLAVPDRTCVSRRDDR